MTVSQVRELRRVRKRRVLRLLSGDGLGRPRSAADDESLQEIRRAIREWGGIAPLR
ncbi:MAG: hypothetical protein QOG49_1416 [Frankiaceae bacterium]|jgi:hypothetical protein|nr:hypothetical protein [Frankiaceae bacterium]